MKPGRLAVCTAQLSITFLASIILPPISRSQAPIFEVSHSDSRINFHVKSSVKIAGKFDKWHASLTFASPDETTGVLEIEIQAASVDSGSGMKDRKLKSKDFFDAERNPLITFKSTRFVRTAPHTFEVDGDFTIRGVSNPEKVILKLSGNGTDTGEIKGSMVFNRKHYGIEHREIFEGVRHEPGHFYQFVVVCRWVTLKLANCHRSRLLLSGSNSANLCLGTRKCSEH